MKRPDKIELLGCTYHIEWVEKGIMHLPYKAKEGEEPYWIFGRCSQKLRRIEISLHDEDGIPVPEEVITNTFWHEVAHAICQEGCYDEENDNEQFIEWLGKNLQFIYGRFKL